MQSAPSRPGRQARSDIREQLNAYLSRLDVAGTGKIPQASLASLMQRLRMEPSEIETMMQRGDRDGLVDYRRFVAWVTADDYRATPPSDGRRLAEDISREVARAVGQGATPEKPSWTLEDALGDGVLSVIAEALRPGACPPFSDWELPLLQALGGRGQQGATAAVKHLLESRCVVDRLAEVIAQKAVEVHEKGPTAFRPAARTRGASADSPGASGPPVSSTKSGVLTLASERRSRSGSAFVGQYGLLSGFIRHCSEQGCEPLSEEECTELLEALDGCSKHGDRQVISRDNSHFEGFDQSIIQQMLASAGIELAPDPQAPAKTSITRAASAICMDDLGNLEGWTDGEAEQVFASFYFDQRSRKDIRRDIRTLMFAFQAPTDLLKRYRIRPAPLAAWMDAVAESYKANPYHSWLHAVDIFQFSYVALTKGGMNRFFNHQDVLALFMAMIGHDVGHVGTTNLFLKQTGHELAIRYNDQSPLENMHAALTFELMKQEGHDCLSGLAKNEFQNVRDKIITAILATDMAHHFELVDRFGSRVSKSKDDPFVTGTKENRELQRQSKADRRMLLQAAIHTADLGHCARPWNVHKHLVAALEEEMFAQGDLEAQLGVPVSPMMNRSTDSLACTQEAFFTKFVLTMLTPYTSFLSDEVGRELIENLQSNGQSWKDRVARHGPLKACEIIAIEP